MFKSLMLAVLAVMSLAALVLLGAMAALTGNWIQFAVPLITLVATMIAMGFALHEQLRAVQVWNVRTRRPKGARHSPMRIMTKDPLRLSSRR